MPIAFFNPFRRRAFQANAITFPPSVVDAVNGGAELQIYRSGRRFHVALTDGYSVTVDSRCLQTALNEVAALVSE